MGSLHGCPTLPDQPGNGRFFRRSLKLRDNPDYFKEFEISGVTHARYFPKAVKAMKDALQDVSIEDVWAQHKAKMVKK